MNIPFNPKLIIGWLRELVKLRNVLKLDPAPDFSPITE